MCGIAGIVDLKGARDVDRDALLRMTRALAHRGPDGEGFYIRPGVGFGHRRLAIIDFEGGAQPFETERGALTFNGEIYNFRTLNETLRAAGHSSRTRSDCETLALGLGAFGASFIERLNGMFAFAFHDADSGETLIARDRFGEKPLYYAHTHDGFLIFASEIGALAQSRLAPLDIDPHALRDYFLYGYAPDPKSIYRAIRKLPPAALMRLRPGQSPRVETYWSISFREDGRHRSLDDAAEELRARIDDAVAGQCVSDAPLGAFLSGGVDSAAIVSSMARGGARVAACTVGFDDAQFDESGAASALATRYRADHVIEKVSMDACADVDRIAAIYGEPFADASAAPTLAVCKAARARVKAALTGDGADEVFAGYRRYGLFAAEEGVRTRVPAPLRAATFGAGGAVWPKLDFLPRPLRWKTTLQALGESSAEALARAVAANLPDRMDAVLSGDLRATTRDYDPVSVIAEAARDAPREAVAFAQHVDIRTWLPGRMLVKVDRAAMAHGLETRSPFLDHDLAGWAAALPPDFRRARGIGKLVLKKALEPRVSVDTLYGAKRGFTPPLARWLRDPAGPLGAFERSGAWRQSGCVDEAGAARMIARHRAGAGDYAQELWTLVMFDAFLRCGPHARA